MPLRRNGDAVSLKRRPSSLAEQALTGGKRFPGRFAPSPRNDLSRVSHDMSHFPFLDSVPEKVDMSSAFKRLVFCYNGCMV